MTTIYPFSDPYQRYEPASLGIQQQPAFPTSIETLLHQLQTADLSDETKKGVQKWIKQFNDTLPYDEEEKCHLLAVLEIQELQGAISRGVSAAEESQLSKWIDLSRKILQAKLPDDQPLETFLQETAGFLRYAQQIKQCAQKIERVRESHKQLLASIAESEELEPEDIAGIPYTGISCTPQIAASESETLPLIPYPVLKGIPQIPYSRLQSIAETEELETETLPMIPFPVLESNIEGMIQSSVSIKKRLIALEKAQDRPTLESISLLAHEIEVLNLELIDEIIEVEDQEPERLMVLTQNIEKCKKLLENLSVHQLQ